MGILSRFIPRRLRAEAEVGKRDPLSGFWYQPVGAVTTSGQTVTQQAAMGLSAYYACIRNISEDLAKLPLDVNRRLRRGREAVPDSTVQQMFNVEANPESTAVVARSTIQHWAMGYGNGYAEIVRRNGKPVELHPIHPDRVRPKRDDGDRLYYEVQTEWGRVTRFVPQDIFHLQGLSPDGVTGYSVARVGCDAIWRALAAQQFAGSFFGNGATFGQVIEYPNALTDKARQALKTSIEEQHSGPRKAFKTFVVEGGKLSAASMGIKPEEAQLLETTQFTVEDLARWFRCPPNKIQYFLRAQGWSTLEALNTDYVIDTLMPWAIRWEQEIARKLLNDGSGQLYARHNFNALLRGDSATRSAFYTAMFRLGVYTVNDILELEDRNPIGPEGDVRFVEGSNLVPLLKIVKGDESDPAVDFKREILKAFVADGVLSDVVANAIQIGQLAKDAGLPPNVEYIEPYLPVLADNGRPVTGETLKDSEGDIVGGVAEEPPEPEQPADPAEDDDEGDAGEGELKEPDVTVESGQDVPEATTEAAAVQVDWLVVFDPMIEDAAERLTNAETRELSKRVDKAGDDRPRFNAWVQKFYAGHRDYAAKTLAPLARAWQTATGTPMDPEIVEQLSTGHATWWCDLPDPEEAMRFHREAGVKLVKAAIQKGLSHVES